MILSAEHDLAESKSRFETTTGRVREARRLIGKIREVYERWLDGDLSTEDALFAISDLLDEDSGAGPAAEHRPCDRPIIVVRESV
jgi:hypothetical protein